MLVFLSGAIAVATASRPSNLTPSRSLQQADKSDQSYYANAHPYLEEPLEKLVKRIPELKALQPAPNQHLLPIILEKTGERVDEFFRNVVDLAAHEHITEEKLDGQGNVTRRLQVEDSYLILRRGTEIWGRVREYRMDAKGNPVDEVGLNNGYFVTANFALNHIYFSTALQLESTFLYLGEEKIAMSSRLPSSRVRPPYLSP